jgi:hypothetical protein
MQRVKRDLLFFRLAAQFLVDIFVCPAATFQSRREARDADRDTRTSCFAAAAAVGVIEVCRDKFRIPESLLFADGNARNFRGEPYMPGSVSEAPA